MNTNLINRLVERKVQACKTVAFCGNCAGSPAKAICGYAGVKAFCGFGKAK